MQRTEEAIDVYTTIGGQAYCTLADGTRVELTEALRRAGYVLRETTSYPRGDRPLVDVPPVEVPA